MLVVFVDRLDDHVHLFARFLQLEEEIIDHTYSDEAIHPEAQGYLQSSATMEYLNLIKDAKEKTSIPIIASINCVGDEKWPEFTKDIEEAGADAIEQTIRAKSPIITLFIFH